MADRSGIEWCDATWNPTVGCTKVSPGCDHCYAEGVRNRWGGAGAFDTLVLHPDRLGIPLAWKRPRRIFVNSMSDLFHTDVPDEFIADVYGVMAHARHHEYIVLTKRHGRMRSLLRSPGFRELVLDRVLRDDRSARERFWRLQWPLRNVILGVSAEDQERAELRIPALLETPAAVRAVSLEPLLGGIKLAPWWLPNPGDTAATPRLGWVIVGGESGPRARPMNIDWARALRDQCVDAGVPYFLKQLGEFRGSVKVGKKAAGRELDGRTWDEYPTTSAVAHV